MLHASVLLLALELWLNVLLAVGVFLVVTLVAVYFAVLRNLPENLETSPAGEQDVPWELDELANDYMVGGFERFGTPLRIELSPETILVPMIHPEHGLFGTVYRIRSSPPRIGYDVVSMLDAEHAALTTGMDHAAGVLPAPTGAFRQILQGASVARLIEEHRTGLRYLEQEGLRARRPAPEEFDGLLALSFRLQRRKFLEARLKHTWLSLWRTVTRRNPSLGPLRGQPGVEDEIEAVRARESGTFRSDERDLDLITAKR